MQLENEPLYIDLKEFASNHSIDLLVSPHDTFDDSTVYVAVLYDNKNVGNVTFRKINVPEKSGYKARLNITWTVGWYTGMVKLNRCEKATTTWESGNESDIANFYDILLNKTIPGQKRKKIDLKKIDIKKTAETWDT